ncbi:MAG: Hsp20/alpha crystallin family protein [Lachnospiraceae bacterium]
MLMPSIFDESLFDDFMDDFPVYNDRDMKKIQKKLYGHRVGNMMKTDVKESDAGYELEMDLPGFKKEDVKVSLDDGYLTISAEKGLDQNEEEKKSGKYIRRERYVGACERSFYVGEDVTREDIKGEFKHGILKLSIPKKQPSVVEEKKYIPIEG